MASLFSNFPSILFLVFNVYCEFLHSILRIYRLSNSLQQYQSFHIKPARQTPILFLLLTPNMFSVLGSSILYTEVRSYTSLLNTFLAFNDHSLLRSVGFAPLLLRMLHTLAHRAIAKIWMLELSHLASLNSLKKFGFVIFILFPYSFLKTVLYGEIDL